MAFAHVSNVMAQLPGLPGFENIPDYKIIEKALIGMGNENDDSGLASTSTTNPNYLQVDKDIWLWNSY